ncbi:MAG: DUF695 domain-containing protein [Balneola sp.]
MKSLLLIFLLPTFYLAMAQENSEVWDTYMASYEDGKPGSVTLRMDLIHSTPMRSHSNILITGIEYTTSREDGFPESETFQVLHKVEDELLDIVTSEYGGILVGSFMYNSERLQYFYIKSPNGLEERLEKFYKENYPANKHYINIKEDPIWEYYREFLYPNEETLNYMGDQSVIRQLMQAGDNLPKERRVDHWLYFESEKDLNDFAAQIKSKNFTIESKSINIEASPHHQLQIWRTDKVDIDTIYLITSELRRLASEHNGVYDGWETFVIK